MMNGVLEDKKEKTLENELKEEDWMKKPREDMNEDEIQKYDEFLEQNERIRQDQEKMKKILNQELKKLLTDIKKIYEEFDNHLEYLFMKKLEFIYRVYEQELILIRIQQSIHEEEKLKNDIRFIENVREDHAHSLSKKIDLKKKIEDLVGEMEGDRECIEAEIAKIETKSLKQVMQLVWVQKEDQLTKKNEILDEKMDKYITEKSLLKTSLNHPLFKIEREHLIKTLMKNPMIHQDTVVEFLQKKFENETEVANEWNKFMKLFSVKVNLKSKVREIQKAKRIIAKFEDGIQIQRNDMASLTAKHEDVTSLLNRLKNMAFLMFRTPSVNIEIPKNKAVFFKSDTILIDRREIDKLNKQIIELGNSKVGALIKNIEEKSKVEGELEDLKILELEVKLSIIESFVLTRLKVSKKLQNLISKKDDKLMETEEKNLKKQIDKLVSSTDKMVAMYKKKESGMKKEINFLTKENDELLSHGGKLQESVTQRQEIFDMVFGKTNNDLVDENKNTNSNDNKFDQKTYAKTIDLIKNRKLYDTAKFIAQEIETLMKELRGLQKRTFPNLG